MKRWLSVALLVPVALVAGVAVEPAAPDPAQKVTVAVLGEPRSAGRHYTADVEGVPEERQALFQTSCMGEIGVRVAGLGTEPYRVHLAYTEMAMSDPWRRVFDIVLNGKVAAKEVCIYRDVGNRRVLSFDFTVVPETGVITYQQRKSVPGADDPLFCLLEIYDRAGRLVAAQSAQALLTVDAKRRSYLGLTREPAGPSPAPGPTAPPWPGTYKIRANQREKLTAADVLGPDGIAYPNWTRVGLPRGIPRLANTLSAADYGAVPDVGTDSSAALQRAIDALEARAGGGVLFLTPGRYYLDRPIFIRGDAIVLRGAGASLTKLISRFSKKGEPPELHGISSKGTIHPRGYYYVWLDPEGLTGVEITAGGKTVQHLVRSGLWENQIFFRFEARELAAVMGAAATELKVSASYRDGTVRAVAHQVRLSTAAEPAERAYGSLAVINFLGRGLAGPALPLAADGRRGDMSLALPPGHGLVAGDRIQLDAPCTPRWEALIATARKGAQNRTNNYQVARVQGDRIFLGEALRLEFPVVDGSFVQRLRPQLHCGLEDLGFEQEVRALVHGVMFEYGWECWVQGVALVHAGDKALYMPRAKRCEVRDSVFDRVWYNVGGSGYIGWEHSFDCLMENVATYAMRHAPVVQWAASGNVIRRSVFHGSDAQWHAGWTNENLYEELTVEAGQRDGAYGNGMWASAPDDPGHGPNGPRNVIYRCSISSPAAGLWMGGMNEAWLILYNRFVVGRGPGVVARHASFDHIIQGNIFVLLDPQPAAIYLGSADCTGVELIDNRFYGPVTKLTGGEIPPSLERGNVIREAGDIEVAQPRVGSIYAWQQHHRAEIQAEQFRRERGHEVP